MESFLGLGSNLGDSKQHIISAIKELQQLSKLEVLNSSSLYISKPVDNSDQNNFFNSVLKIKTSYSPNELLEQCKLIENSHQRIKLYHWGPRSLDIDIISYGSKSIKTPKLTIPHPEIINRDFVIIPLLELEPTLNLPGLGKISLLPSPPSNIIDKIKIPNI